jgi:hypothetical protein
MAVISKIKKGFTNGYVLGLCGYIGISYRVIC